MRRDPRKQPWQTFPFWFLILSGMAMTVAWKLDLIQPKPVEVASEEVVAEEELSPDWANESTEEGPVAAIEDIVEPVAEGESPRSFPEDAEAEITSVPEQSEPATEAEATDVAYEESEAEPVAEATADTGLLPTEKVATTPTETRVTSRSEDASQPLKTARHSPFGNPRVEIKGNRTAKRASTAADNATWAKSSPSPDVTSKAAAKSPAESSEILQTAAVESADKVAAQGVELALANAAPDTAAPAGPAKSKDQIDLAAIDQMIADGEDVEANFQLSNLYWKRPEIRDQLAGRLRSVSYRIYFAPEPHYMDAYEVRPGDVLQRIAKDYSVSWEYLAMLNRTDPKKIRPGQQLKVIQGPFSAVVDLSDMELTVHAHGHFVHAFPVGIGRDNSSPIGTFKVQEKLKDPTYYGPAGVIEHDDPQNPLGEYWLDLGDSYGIHGTIDESSIGKADSQGCIRLKDKDISDVFDLLTIGSEVLIRR